MKNSRLILIIGGGGLLTYYAYQSQFKTFLFGSIIELGLILLGITIFIWTLVAGIKNYRTNRQLKTFALTMLCLIFAFIIATLRIRTQINFNKPTLLKVFYDGDFNGVGIDFKTDGTYIFDNSAIGISDYFYGTYKIAEDIITMDKDKFDNLPNLKYLEIREKKTENNKANLYLYQIDSVGNLIGNSNKFRVTIDNRKNKKKK
jgi:hypothetical protein